MYGEGKRKQIRDRHGYCFSLSQFQEQQYHTQLQQSMMCLSTFYFLLKEECVMLICNYLKRIMCYINHS